MHKLLKNVSLPITEEEYRNDGCLHYSTLATYERGGFASIATLGEKKESESLLFGSLVDTILTGGQDEFNERFFVADYEKLKPSEMAVTKALFDMYHTEHNSLLQISDADLLAVANEVGYGKGWLDKTRITNMQKCAEYYNLLVIAETKTVVDNNTYQQALAAVDALMTSPATKDYFAADNPFNDRFERLYQGKFKAVIDGLEYSCMADLIVVDHEKKIIYPCDLKTSSHLEYEFFESFLRWNYDIQAREYAAILKDVLSKDEYFKDFRIENYRFIVVNKDNLDPRVWTWKYTFADTDITMTSASGKVHRLRNFRNIGRELSHYLETQQKVPDGITDKPNDLAAWIERS